MSDATIEKAKELGRLLGQTDQYKALQRARSAVDDDRELTELLGSMAELEGEIAQGLQRGEQPDPEKREEYESTFSTLQQNAGYQSLIAAQSNFEKVMKKVNEAIGEGMSAAAESRIILPS